MKYLMLWLIVCVIEVLSQEYRVVSNHTALGEASPLQLYPGTTKIFAPGATEPKYVFNWTAPSVLYYPESESVVASTLGKFGDESFSSLAFFKGTNFLRRYSTRQIWDLSGPGDLDKSGNAIRLPWGRRFTLQQSPLFWVETNGGLLVGFNMETGDIARQELIFDYLRFTNWYVAQEARNRRMKELRIYAGNIWHISDSELTLTRVNELQTGKAFTDVQLKNLAWAEHFSAKVNELWCFIVIKDSQGGDRVVAARELVERFAD